MRSDGYIGIDLEVRYSVKTEKGHRERATMLMNSAAIRAYMDEIKELDPEDIISIRLTPKPTNVDKEVHSKDELIEELYKYLMYVPE